MVQVDKRSHLVLFKQNQRNHDPYTSELANLAYKHDMMGTVSKLYVSNNTWIYVYIKKLDKISTPIPTPESFNSNSNSNSGSFNSNSNSGKSLEYQLQLQLQLQEFQLQLQLRPISRISTPTPTPTPEVSTPIPTPTPELELELNPTPTPTPELTPTLDEQPHYCSLKGQLWNHGWLGTGLTYKATYRGVNHTWWNYQQPGTPGVAEFLS